MFVLKAVEKVVSLIPYKARAAVYHTPFLPIGRVMLGKVMPSNALVEITAGPLKGFRMWVNLKCQKYYWLGTWEPAVQERLEKLILPGWVCYDIGAHIGYFSLLMARLCEEKVFAFEPEPKNFRVLRKHAEINRLSDIVMPVRLAVSSKTGFAYFGKGYSSSTGHLYNSAEVYSENNLIGVKTITLDHFVYVRGNPGPDFVKIDAEGFEGKVLEGAQRVLEEACPVVLCEIHNPEQGSEVYHILSEQRYLFFDVEEGLKRLTEPKIGGHILAYRRRSNLLADEE